MKRYYPYDNCSCAADATDKIIFNGDTVVYFPDDETAGHYLNEYAAHNDFTYELFQREIDWETGPKKNWIRLEVGSSDYLRAWQSMVGIKK